MIDYRVVLCEACGSEGCVYHAYGNDPEADWIEPCSYCEGTGGELIEVEPIEEEDLFDA